MNVRNIVWLQSLPDDVHMVTHDDKSIDSYPIILGEKTKTIKYDSFILVWFKQVLPFIDGYSNELRMIGWMIH